MVVYNEINILESSQNLKSCSQEFEVLGTSRLPCVKINISSPQASKSREIKKK